MILDGTAERAASAQPNHGAEALNPAGTGSSASAGGGRTALPELIVGNPIA
jgi:hypothetical protein